MAARREALEEIGLPMSDSELPAGYSVEHLTELPTNLAVTELGVRPCVAYLKGPAPSAHDKSPDTARDILPKLDAREVAAVYTAPFRNFLHDKDLDENVRKAVPGKWYHGRWINWHEKPWRMHEFYVPVKPESVFLASRKNRAADAQSEVEGKMPVDKAMREQEIALAQPRYRVWGMTARILVDCARVAYGEEPNYEHNGHFGDEDMIQKLLKMGRLQPIRKPGEQLTREVMQEAARVKL